MMGAWRCIWPMRSSTQPADRRASASWSQQSSMVSQSMARPWERKSSVTVAFGSSVYGHGHFRSKYDTWVNRTVFPLLTECFCQQSRRQGRSFLCTTTSCMSSRDGCWPTSSSNGSMYSSTGPVKEQPRVRTDKNPKAKLYGFIVSPSAAVHRAASSQRTRPKAYISIRRKESRWKLMAPSRTSGAM